MSVSVVLLCQSGNPPRKASTRASKGIFPKQSPLTSGGSLWAGEVVTGKTTPERKGEALSLIYAFSFFVIQPTLARYKCRK